MAKFKPVDMKNDTGAAVTQQRVDNVSATLGAATPSQRRAGSRFYDRAHRLAVHGALGDNPGVLDTGPTVPGNDAGPRKMARTGHTLARASGPVDPVDRVHSARPEDVRREAGKIAVLSPSSPAGMSWEMNAQAAHEVGSLPARTVSALHQAKGAQEAQGRAVGAVRHLKNAGASADEIRGAETTLSEVHDNVMKASGDARKGLEGTQLVHAGVGAILRAHDIDSGHSAPENIIPMNNKTGAFFENITDPGGSDRATVDGRSHDIAYGARQSWDTDRGLGAAGRYAYMEEVHRRAAQKSGLKPHQVQAISWLADKADAEVGRSAGIAGLNRAAHGSRANQVKPVGQ